MINLWAMMVRRQRADTQHYGTGARVSAAVVWGETENASGCVEGILG